MNLFCCFLGIDEEITSGECDGVDLNRNFPSGWGDGSEHFKEDSKYAWDEIYKGHEGSDNIEKEKSNILGFKFFSPERA